MTKEQIQERITAKATELQQVIQEDSQAAQARQQQLAANQKRANQLEGAIGELRALAITFDEPVKE